MKIFILSKLEDKIILNILNGMKVKYYLDLLVLSIAISGIKLINHIGKR